MKLLATFITAATLATGPLHAQPATQQPPPVTPLSQLGVTEAELEFMLAATQANLAQIEAGHLALRRAKAPAVRALAERLLEDHGQAHVQLQRIAQAHRVVLPGTPSQQQVEVINGLQGLQGDYFERDYVARIGIDAHREAIALYQRKVANTGADPALGQYATATLQRLRQHLAAAESLQAQLAQGAGTRSAGGTR